MGLVALLCALAMLGACRFETEGVRSPAVCGNDRIDDGEECDGVDLAGLSCESLNRGAGLLACRNTCELNFTGCRGPAECGNGLVEGAEECDDGNADACDGCTAACAREACGNGRVECDEECDDGNSSDDDACVTGCLAARCGDGFVQTGVELCDTGEGAPELGSDCVAEGYGDGELACGADCAQYDTSGCDRPMDGACVEDAECSGGVCLTEVDMGWPGGTCTRTCDALDLCSDGACIVIVSGTRHCVKRCLDTGDCRLGYHCSLDPWDGVDLVCLPHCETDDQCQDTGICNPWKRLCNEPVESNHSDNGASCGASSPPCKGSCWAGQQDGYCVSPCSLSTGSCPGDGVCANVGSGFWGDYGYCLDGCAVEGDCDRLDYSCLSNPYGSGTACMPN